MASLDTTHKDDDEVSEITNQMQTTQISSRPSSKSTSRPPSTSRPSSRLTIETPTEYKNPIEDDFINEYFKDKTENPKINRIYIKYLEVKDSFQDNLPEKYNNLKEEDKGNIKKDKSLGWEIILNDKSFDRKSFVYAVDNQFVTKTDDEKTIFKEIQFNNISNPQTLFMVTLEITMQKLAYDIVKTGNNVKIPEITNHYLVKLDDAVTYQIIIEMEFVEHIQLEENNVIPAMNALELLRFNNIFHFDTHQDNIVQSTPDNKVVILDFGKAQIHKNPDISSGTGLFNPKPKKKDDFSKTVDFNYKNWKDRTTTDIAMRTVVDFYGGIKKKYKRRKYTRKIGKKRKSKKTKRKSKKHNQRISK